LLGRAWRYGALVAAAVLGVGVLLVRATHPRRAGKMRLPGLTHAVEVLRDRWGVPHIYAESLWDLFLALGFVQAQDRLWQMDFHRRLATGTLAEILGEKALPLDRLVRRVGIHRAAAREWEGLEGEERHLLEAYAAGVNAYIASGPPPLESILLRYRIRPWSPADSIAWARFMAWSLSGNWDQELVRLWIIERFGAETMAELEPTYPPGKPVVVPPGATSTGPGPGLGDDYSLPLAGHPMSNNWVVDGHKSATGRPLLANDPHLALVMPSLWYEVHLESPELRVAGVSLPGLPAIIIGHNQRIAWGVTAAMADQDDLYLEELDPHHPTRYRWKDGWEEGQLLREEIRVRGRGQPVVEEVLVTRHGPIITPCISGEERPLALRSVCIEEIPFAKGIMGIMRAQSWEEFRQALFYWPAPALNFVYADVDGNIGYQLAGSIPRRRRGHGIVPMPGWTGEFEWEGFVPFQQLPWALNPPTHWIASANNQVALADYPHFLSATYADSPRIERIVQMLGEKERISVADCQRMQNDLLSLPGQELVRRILSLRPTDPWCQRAQSFLKVWDGTLAADSVAAAIVEVCFVHLVRKALEEKVGAWADFLLGKPVHPIREGPAFFMGAASWLLRKMEERPDWFRDRTWQEVMTEALKEATEELRRRLGDDMSRWQWGRLHRQAFRHPLGQMQALAPLFNRGPYPIGGDMNTVAQSAFIPHRGYDATSFAVSWRMIVDLADFNRSLGVLPGGQWGQPGSRHYADQLPLWLRGEYHPMLWDRQAVEGNVESRLVLEP